MPTLETKRLLIQKLRPEDAEDMYEYSSDSRVTKFLLWSPHINLFETIGYLDYARYKYKSGNFHEWGLILKEMNKLIGTVGFTTIDWENCRAELGYVLAPKFWRLGLMTEALGRLIGFAFNECGFSRLELKIMAGNESSKNLALKLGFKFEGVLRNYMVIKGKSEDICMYSLLRNDSEAIQYID